MKNNKVKLTIIFIFSAIIFCLFFGFLILKTNKYKGITSIKTYTNRLIQKLTRKEHKIHIFIHGSFNSGLGLLNIKEVLKDDISGTRYEQAVQQLRQDQFFYQEQTMLDQGLVKINPTFHINKDDEKFAAYPIIRGYEMVLEAVNPKNSINHFYTFGWSGFLSQKERIKSSINLYNALNEEIKKYNKNGISPKIRIITHSHGGNVALNLGSIAKILKKQSELLGKKDLTKNTPKAYHLKSTIELIKNLPLKNKASQKEIQNFNYKPELSNFKIDELIMLGAPIQEENSSYTQSDLFKHVYNIYSQQDVVQTADVFSTKNRKSKQRVENIKKKNIDKVIQAKIKIDNPINQIPALNNTTNKGWWNKFSSPKSKDPTHKDLWHLAWNTEFTQKNFPLKPLPLVVIVPFLINAIEKTHSINDIDLNLSFDDQKQIKLYISNHDQKEIKSIFSFPSQIIEKIKDETKQWEPKDISRYTSYQKLKTASSKTFTKSINP